MSKKTNTVAALETAKTTSTRVKENYRLTGIGSRVAIINEAEKSISAGYRSAIKSLIIDLMTDSNVDILNINFIRSSVDSNGGSNLVNVPEKYTISRLGEFVNIGIDNYLNDQWKVRNTTKIVFTTFSTNSDTFEVNSFSKSCDIRNPEIIDVFYDYLIALHYIYCCFIENLK